MYLCRSVLSVPLFGQMKESYRNCRCYKRCSMKFLGQENVREREREGLAKKDAKNNNVDDNNVQFLTVICWLSLTYLLLPLTCTIFRLFHTSF